MEVKLRIAEKKDFSEINRLFILMLQSIYNNKDVKGYGENDLDYYFEGSENRIYLAEIGGNVAAFLSVELHREEENFIYYDDFSVEENYRNKGIGSLLMKEAENYAECKGINKIVLHAEKSNKKAIGFYEKRGFTLLRDEGSRIAMIKYL